MLACQREEVDHVRALLEKGVRLFSLNFVRFTVYVTGNLCNQALRIMTGHFSHYAKCLNSSGISCND